MRALAGWLVGRGVGRGDRVAVSLANSVESVELLLASATIGAIWVGINPNAPAAECRRQLDTVGARLVVGERDLDAVRRADDADPHVELPESTAPCAIAFTSGTTGTPKALVHSRAGISLVAACSAQRTLSRDDRVGVSLPLSILNVMIVGPLAALAAGATAILISPRNATELAAAVRDGGLTRIRALVPAIVYDLVHIPAIKPDSLASLTVAECGASGLAEELRGQFEAKFARRLTGSYGLSEAPAVVCHEDAAASHTPGASGTPLPHVRISIRDDEGRELPVGTEGEIWVAAASDGPWAGVYRPSLGIWSDGCLHPRDANETAFATGDLGFLDGAGALHVTARKSDVIVRGGVNVTATELQAVLAEIPGVRDVAVVGRYDRRLGERIVAFVEPAAGGQELTDEFLRIRARELLSRGKVPDAFVVMPTLPRNAMGKVAKAELAGAAEGGGI